MKERERERTSKKRMERRSEGDCLYLELLNSGSFSFHIPLLSSSPFSLVPRLSKLLFLLTSPHQLRLSPTRPVLTH